MALTTPRVIGPLTQWSNRIRVEGCLPGAKVEVRRGAPGGALLAEGVAGGGNDEFSLMQGAALAPGDNIVAAQRLGGEQSNWTAPDAATVVGAPPSHYDSTSFPALVSRLFVGSRRIWVVGVLPGSLVEVAYNNSPLGSGRAGPEGARIKLALPLSLGWNISIRAVSPPGFPAPAGAPKVTLAKVMPLPVAPGQRLPTPQLTGSAPIGCDPAIPIGAIVDGATVTVNRRSEQIVDRSEFDAERLWMVLSSSLTASGGHLEITQGLDGHREYQVLDSDPLQVPFAPAAQPPIPLVLPVCAGSSAVLLSGLMPGAVVHLSETLPDGTGKLYRGMVASTLTAQTFNVEPLSDGSKLKIWHERCGLVGAAVEVNVAAGDPTEQPKMLEPVVGCARAVRVVNVHPGARLRLWATDLDGTTRLVSEVAAAPGRSVRLIPVPLPAVGQTLSLEQSACSQGWQKTHTVTVVQASDLPLVTVKAPIETSGALEVIATSGAFVEIFWEVPGRPARLIGAGVVDAEDMYVPLFKPLERGYVYARQTLCNQTSRQGTSVDVLPSSRIFVLPNKLERFMTSDVISWQSSTLSVAFDGSYEFTGVVENKDKEADASFDLQVQLNVTPPFGLSLPFEVGSPDGGVGAQSGRRIKGFAPQVSPKTTGTFLMFRDPLYWQKVLSASAKFDWYVASKRYTGQDTEDCNYCD